VLVGDIGGTNARFALARLTDDGFALEHHQSFPAEQVPTFLEAVRAFIDGGIDKPVGGVLAVAGPIIGGEVDLTNSPWRVSERELASLGYGPIRLINDFEALAWGAPLIPPTELASLGGPEAGDTGAALAVVGPGTGFGVSTLARDSYGREIALPAEGGHVSFAPEDAVEDEILRILRGRFGRVSVERLICGPGLTTLHEVLAQIDGRTPEVREPAAITAQALAEAESHAAATLNRFCGIFGAVAGDIALITGARGGVYVAGGIAPRILPFLQASPFRARFDGKGRYRGYMQRIPTRVILHRYAALLGAARVAFTD
jgi:glucokinase